MHYLVKRIQSERHNIFSIVSTSLIGIFASFLLMLAFANLLDPNTLGVYQYLVAAVSIIGSVSLTGINSGIIRATSKRHFSFLPLALRYTWYSAAIPVLIALITAGYYAFKGNYIFAASILLGTLLVTVVQIQLRYNAIYIGIEEFKKSNYLLKANALGPVFILLPALFFFKNPAILLVLYFASSLLAISGVLYFLKTKKEITALIKNHHVHETEAAENQKQLKFSIHQSIITLLNVGAAHLDKIIVFQLLGAEATAVYFIAISIPDRLRSLLKQFEPYLLSKFLKYTAGNYNAQMVKKFFFAIFCIIPFILLYILFSRYIFNLFFPQYSEAIYLTAIYSISLLASAAIIPYSSMKAHSTNQSFYNYTVVYSTIKIILFFALTSLLGIMGSIIATVVTSLFITFYVLFLAVNEKNLAR